MNRNPLLGSAWAVVFLFLAEAATAQTAADDMRQGNQLYAQKDYTDAIQSYQAAITINPPSAAAYQGLGNCDIYLGKKVEALTAYQKSLELNPQNSVLAAYVAKLNPSVTPNIQPTPTPTVFIPIPAAPEGIQLPTAVPTTAIPVKTPPSSKSPSVAPNKNFELSVMGGISFTDLVNSVGSITGVGGGLDGFYLVEPWLGLGLSTGYHSFNYQYNSLTIVNGTETVAFHNQVSLGYWDLLAAGKFYIGTQDLRPYLFGGVGACVTTVLTTQTEVTTVNGSPTTTTPLGNSSLASVYPEVAGGLGAAYYFDPGFGVFVQGKYYLIFNGIGNATFIPVEVGLDLSF